MDSATGDIVLDSAVFFETNSSAIKDSGRELLARFLPVSLGVLTRPEYQAYVGEIIIEGHTDTAGSYISNLKLSQKMCIRDSLYSGPDPGPDRRGGQHCQSVYRLSLIHI